MSESPWARRDSTAIARHRARCSLVSSPRAMHVSITYESTFSVWRLRAAQGLGRGSFEEVPTRHPSSYLTTLSRARRTLARCHLDAAVEVPRLVGIPSAFSWSAIA